MQTDFHNQHNQHRGPGPLSPHSVNDAHHPQPKHNLHHKLPFLLLLVGS